MNRLLHIFAKDSRHLWLEILISLVLTALMVLTSASAHLSRMESVSFSPAAAIFSFFTVTNPFLPGLLTVLVPLSWWILISPLVHGERLIGDRQFWLTRPYEWRELLAAKMLFVFAFVLLPLFIAQCLVLARAGFNPLSYLPGLLYNLLLITSMLILPMVTLAAITRNFARMTLAILAVIGYVIGIAALAPIFPGTAIPTPLGDYLSLGLIICGCTAVVIFQYATRRTGFSLLVLAAMLGLVAILACAAPDQALVGRRYPVQAGQSRDIELTYVNDPGGGPVVSVARSRSEVAINLPIHISGIAAGSMMIPEALKVTLDAPDGSRWTSFWQPIYMDKFFPGDRTARAGFVMPRSMYEKLKPAPLHAHIVLALVRARQAETTTISLPLNEFQIEGFGTCIPQTGFFDKPYEIGGIACRAALRQPPLTFVRVLWSYDDCRASSGEHHNVIGDAWVGSLNRPPAEFAIAPVWSSPIGFTNREQDYQFNEPRHICPGTPANFTRYTQDGRTQVAIDLQGLILPELSRGQALVIERN